VLIAFVQGIVRAGHEHFAPLNQRGGEESRDRAKDDFLDKCGVHRQPKEAEVVPPTIGKQPWYSYGPIGRRESAIWK
jgi:hypothetical protein